MMSDADKLAELEAYVQMMELSFESRVAAAIERRLPHEVSKEITRQKTEQARESGRRHGKWVRETFGDGHLSAKTAMQQLGVNVPNDF